MASPKELNCEEELREYLIGGLNGAEWGGEDQQQAGPSNAPPTNDIARQDPPLQWVLQLREIHGSDTPRMRPYPLPGPRDIFKHAREGSPLWQRDLKGHTGCVNAVEFSPTEEFVVSGELFGVHWLVEGDMFDGWKRDCRW